MPLLLETPEEELRSMRAKDLAKFLSLQNWKPDKLVTVVDKGKSKDLWFATIIDGEKWAFKGSGKDPYIVQRNGDVGNIERTDMLSCNCPSWVFNNGSHKRFCKHCKAIMTSGELDLNKTLDIIEKREQVFQDRNIW